MNNHTASNLVSLDLGNLTDIPSGDNDETSAITSVIENLLDTVENIAEDDVTLINQFIRRQEATVEEKYYGVPYHYYRLIADTKIDLTHTNNLATVVCRNAVPFLDKYYRETFLPQLGLSYQQLIDGNITLAQLRNLPLTKESSWPKAFIFDFSDFLDWERDQELYHRYHDFTTEVYPDFVSGVLDKKSLAFVLHTLDRFEEFLLIGLRSTARQLLETLRNLPISKPGNITEVKRLLSGNATNATTFQSLVNRLVGLIPQDEAIEPEFWDQFNTDN